MNVTFDITKTGGQLGPVKFRIGRQKDIDMFPTSPIQIPNHMQHCCQDLLDHLHPISNNHQCMFP
jgi:hypothetical protein